VLVLGGGGGGVGEGGGGGVITLKSLAKCTSFIITRVYLPHVVPFRNMQ